MPTTPSSAVPYPALTDVPDVPYWLKQLAEFIDAGILKGSNFQIGSTTSTAQKYLGNRRLVGADVYESRWYLSGTGNEASVSLVKNGTIVNAVRLREDGGANINGKAVMVGGTFAGTPDASGYLTVTHGLGFTPSQVQATPKSPITAGAAASIFGMAMTDSYGPTTFRVRCLNAAGGAFTAAVTGSWAAS